MGNKYFKKRLLTLLARDPHCYWCGKEVFKASKHPKLHNHATIDHFFSKARGKRPVVGKHLPPNTQTLLLCCLQCNTRRANNQQVLPNKIIRWCKSGRFPRWIKPLKPLILYFYNLKDN